jgi:hypothetical protein
MFAAAVRAFFRDIPETALLFDVEQMIKDGRAFDYGTIAPQMIERSWVPSYCRAQPVTRHREELPIDRA